MLPVNNAINNLSHPWICMLPMPFRNDIYFLSLSEFVAHVTKCGGSDDGSQLPSLWVWFELFSFELWIVYIEKCCEYFGHNWVVSEDNYWLLTSFSALLVFILCCTCSLGLSGGWNQKPKDLRSGSELFSGSQCNLEQVTLAAGQVSTDHEAEADIQC